MATATNCAMAAAMIPMLFLRLNVSEPAPCGFPILQYLDVVCISKAIYALLHLFLLSGPKSSYFRLTIGAIYASIFFYFGWLLLGIYWYFNDVDAACLDHGSYGIFRVAMLDSFLFPICSCWLWGPRMQRYDVQFESGGWPPMRDIGIKIS
jgi:hypothetical protein